MIIILDGVSGTGKSTISQELQKVLQEKRECHVIAHPSKTNFYGNFSRKLINLKYKVQNELIIKVIDLLIGLCAVEDFKNSIKLARQNPEVIYIWERSPLSTLVYNATNSVNAKILASKIVSLGFPPETYWILLSDIKYGELVKRLKERKRDNQDLTANRSLLIEQTARFVIYLRLLNEKPFFSKFNAVYNSLLWHSDVHSKVKDILTFIKLNDTYLFF